MNAIDWAQLERDSLARRTVRFDGGFVVRRREPGHGAFNLCGPSKETMKRIEDWYAALFVRLARRLRYGGRKAVSARRRLIRGWGSQGPAEAIAYMRDLPR